MNKQHVRPGRTARRERQNGKRNSASQTFNPLTNEWEHNKP